jgi:hypothetical protein
MILLAVAFFLAFIMGLSLASFWLSYVILHGPALTVALHYYGGRTIHIRQAHARAL